MASNPHFASVPSWNAAEPMLTFRPLIPLYTAGFALQGLRVHILDHRKRDVPIGDRSLEAHYGALVVTQSRKGREEARRLACDVSYGRLRSEARIAGHNASVYDLGPEPEPGDIDGRPASRRDLE